MKFIIPHDLHRQVYGSVGFTRLINSHCILHQDPTWLSCPSEGGQVSNPGEGSFHSPPLMQVQ